nr:hypothetical protein CFP56_78914 [Quercus suber]
MGNFVFLHNPSDPAEVIVREVQNGASFCSWGSVGNAAVDDGSRIVKNLVYTCAKVGLGELHQALRSGDRRFTIKEEMEWRFTEGYVAADNWLVEGVRSPCFL